MGPAPWPIVSTIIVFVVVLLAVATIGLRLVQSSSKRSSVSPGAPSIPAGAIAPPPPPFIQPGISEFSVCCPRCGVRGSFDYCTGCGFDLRTLNRASVVSAVPVAYPATGRGTGGPEADRPGAMPVAPPPATAKRRKYGIWPKMIDVASARFAAKQAMGAAFFCAGSTLLFVFLARAGVSPIQGLDNRALVDAAVFAFLGFAILRMSRIAAVGALGLYIFERIAMWDRFTIAAGPAIPMMVLLLICFINGVRGTFAYQRYQDPSVNFDI